MSKINTFLIKLSSMFLKIDIDSFNYFAKFAGQIILLIIKKYLYLHILFFEFHLICTTDMSSNIIQVCVTLIHTISITKKGQNKYLINL